MGSIFWMLLSVLFANLEIGSSKKLSVNDILNEDYLPGKLVLETLMLDGNNTYPNTTAQGDFSDAFQTMGYHRKMMNEYLCRSYVAEEILEDLLASKKPRVQKRFGPPHSFNRTAVRRHRPNKKIDLGAVKDSMLSDPGSSNYKNWLSRTTTLEDVYRHYDDDDADDDDDDGDDLIAEADSSHDDAEYAIAEDYDGEVTGFAMQHTHTAPSYAPAPAPATSYGAPPHSAGAGPYAGSSGGSSYGGGGGSSYGGDTGGHHSSSGGGGDYGGGGGGGGGKDKMMKLKDLFNLALTAMAFLAFAMFKMQVIMCIAEGFMGSSTTASSLNVMMMMPGPGTPGGGIDINVPGGPGGIDINLPGGGRFKRSEEGAMTNSETNMVLNEMARRVMENMEAFYYVEKDDGDCLRRLLCENNRYSRRLSGHFKIWLPVWSFGMSWISGRFSKNLATPTAMLENLRASVLGLGNSKCNVVFPNCSRKILQSEKENRRRKRRRRRRGENQSEEL